MIEIVKNSLQIEIVSMNSKYLLEHFARSGQHTYSTVPDLAPTGRTNYIPLQLPLQPEFCPYLQNTTTFKFKKKIQINEFDSAGEIFQLPGGPYSKMPDRLIFLPIK